MKLDTSQMLDAAQDATKLMKALSNESRLMILCQLIDRERSVTDLAEQLGLRQTAVSQQLSLLRRDGLVAGRRDGHQIFYSLADPAAQRVIEVLYDLYCPKPGT